MPRSPLPGKPYPLGATPTSRGTNFALYSENATEVHVCFFDEKGEQTDSFRLVEVTGFVWHGLVLGIKTGQRYDYRVYGPWDPENGLRFNPAKLLVDPYAKSITGQYPDENDDRKVLPDHRGPIYPYEVESGDDLKKDDTDDAAFVPRSIVVDDNFDWEGDCPLLVPLEDSIIYEVHVRGFSKLNPDVPEKLRGTFAGLAHDASIAYLKSLGVTAVELLPVHHFIDEGHLLDKGLRDYWGYNTLGYFAPMARYCSSGDDGEQVIEFKNMVKRLHREGIEVILDVVYNHTCEGNEKGPMLSFKGIDNTTYYRTVKDNQRFYMDYTGTGNTFNVYHPQVLKLLMDSLRYWVTEMHVDGFRFDLASTLARELHDVNKLGPFFDTIHQDPTLADTKLIAEPWDVGEGGYQVGNFPILWAEWNGKYRDAIRRFWKGDPGLLSDFAYRITGSSDLYKFNGRAPSASINFVTAHDGFTLCDLVSYNEKHNEANRDNNNDGSDSNDSWNMGAEGPTDDENINREREKQIRNFLTTLFISQGVAMLTGGDEFGRSQHGNNNCYCQDDELTWYDWNLNARRKRLQEFTCRLIKLRKAHPNLHRRRFFHDHKIRGEVVKAVVWYGTDGQEVSDEVWEHSGNKSIGVMYNGMTLGSMDEEGNKVIDDSFLILVNASDNGVEYVLPEPPNKTPWRQVLDTENIDAFYEAEVHDKVILGGRSVRVYTDNLRESPRRS
jgi:isoamylase